MTYLRQKRRRSLTVAVVARKLVSVPDVAELFLLRCRIVVGVR